MRTKHLKYAMISAMLAGGAAMAQVSVSHYDDLSEGFYGQEFWYNGVTYKNVNNVDGVFPDGSTFEAGGGIEGLGDTIIVERATLLFDEFPGFGSPHNVLTFGKAFIPGDNLSLGALSTVTMALDDIADFASIDIGYYENGPWGGISYHFDAIRNGQVVASDSFVISDLGGRDNVATSVLSVGGAEFDTLHLYARFGDNYTGPRGILDNLTLHIVPAPGGLALLTLGAALGVRRRR